MAACLLVAVCKMRLKTSFLLLMFVSLLACGSDDHQPADTPWESGSSAIVGGQPTTEFDSVVFLLNEGYGCTGVVVAPQVVLTAAH